MKAGEGMTVFNSNSVEETEGFAEKIGKVVTPGTCIAFFGGLGMGKTAFTRGLARGMGIDCHVSSPTFAIVNDYGGNPPLVHFDMYKVDSWDSLYSSGFFDYLDMGAVLSVEWSENIADFFEDNNITVTFEKLDETVRKITIEGVDCNW